MRILIICLRPLPDVLAVTPLALALRAADPDTEIDLVVPDHDRVLVGTPPFLRSVFGYDRKGYHRNRRHAAAFLKMLRAQHYDLAINLTDHERAAWMAIFSGAHRRCGHAPAALARFFGSPFRETTDCSRADAFLAIATGLGVPSDAWRGLGVDTRSAAAAAALWAAHPLPADRPVIALHVAADPPGHRWPVERWVELLDAVTARGWTPVLLASGADAGSAHDVNFLARTPVPVLGADQPLVVLAALLRRCAVLVSANHALLHVAAAQDIPHCALLRPGDLAAYAGYTAPHVLLNRRAQHCCEAYVCPSAPCLTRITVDDVLTALDTLMPAGVCV